MAHLNNFLAICFLIFISFVPTGETKIETVYQLQPYRMLVPGEEIRLKIGFPGSQELNPCWSAVKVHSPFGDDVSAIKVETYCRISVNQYAYVYVKNESLFPVAIYDKVRVSILK
jgi:hypothetical protein